LQYAALSVTNKGKNTMSYFRIICLSLLFLLVASLAVSCAAGSSNANGPDEPWETITVENAASVTELALLKQDAVITSLEWSPDSRFLAIGDRSGVVHLLRPSGSDVVPVEEFVTLGADSETIRDLAFSPDGTVFAAVSDMSNEVLLWRLGGDTDFSGAKPVAILQADGPFIYSVAFSPDGALIAAGGLGFDGSVHVWRSDAMDKPPIEPIATILERELVHSIEWSPDGTLLAIGTQNDTIYLWRVDSIEDIPDEPFAILEGDNATVINLVFSQDGTLLASASVDWSTSPVWHVPEHSVEEPVVPISAENPAGQVTNIDFSPVEPILATSHRDGTIRLWQVDADEGISDESIAVLGVSDTSWAHLVAFSPGGGLLASANGNAVRLWGISSSE
jgi:WD40 repeat protein